MNLVFCGAGALGSHTLFLARDLEANLSIIDFDRVETKNLASQWFVRQSVGKKKATALKMQLQHFYQRRASDFPVKLTDLNIDTLLGNADLVIECFDNIESRLLVQDFVRCENIPCLHGGLAADGEFGMVRWDTSFVPDAEDTTGQATCEGSGFLPIVLNVSAAIVNSIDAYLTNERLLNWNIAPLSTESFPEPNAELV